MDCVISFCAYTLLGAAIKAGAKVNIMNIGNIVNRYFIIVFFMFIFNI